MLTRGSRKVLSSDQMSCCNSYFHYSCIKIVENALQFVTVQGRGSPSSKPENIQPANVIKERKGANLHTGGAETRKVLALLLDKSL